MKTFTKLTAIAVLIFSIAFPTTSFALIPTQVNQGGTGANTFDQGWIYSNGGVGPLLASSSPVFGYITATSTTGINYIAGVLGIGTTSPFATFAINPVAGQAQNQFVVGSSTKTNFIVTNTGNVGIGTANPAFALDVTSGTAVSNVIRVNASAANGNSSFAANRTLTSNSSALNFSTAGTNDWLIGMPYATLTTSGSDFNIIDGSNNIRFLISKTTGNIGIGTTTPEELLTLGGSSPRLSIDSTSQDPTIYLKKGGLISGKLNAGANQLRLFGGSDTTADMVITSTSFVGIGTTSPASKFDLINTVGGSTPLLSIASSTSGSGTTTAFIITSNGRVGIASSSPSGMLDVVGTTTIKGNLLVTRTGEVPTYNDSNLSLMDIVDNVNSYTFVGLQNKNNGVSASSDFVWGNDRTTTSTYYADCGVASSNYADAIFEILDPNDGYCFSTDGAFKIGSGTTTAARHSTA
jgi:hypothetical protein